MVVVVVVGGGGYNVDSSARRTEFSEPEGDFSTGIQTQPRKEESSWIVGWV